MKLIYKIDPIAKGRPRFRIPKGRNYPLVYTDSKTAAYEIAVKMITRTQLPKGFKPFDGAIKVTISIEIARPKSVTREYPTVKPDLDNYAKALLDALNGLVWHDDAQICWLEVKKTYNIQSLITIEIKGDLNAIPTGRN
jgi:Holliday junction resolvase RusA-like endonuclease